MKSLRVFIFIVLMLPPKISTAIDFIYPVLGDGEGVIGYNEDPRNNGWNTDGNGFGNN